METIFHEKQEGSLCAQHCLNALLQGQYFTAVDLAEIARQLDETERATMAEAGVDTEEYRGFIQQPSSNFDDSGFFSIQVITNALGVWGLDLVPYNSQSQVAVAARQDPKTQSAYICNFKEHWFAIRNLGFQWFNLNSLLSGPELVSSTYLSMFLTQLQQEGYAIFVIVGSLPDCEADQLLKIMPAEQKIKPKLLNEKDAPSTSGAPPKDADEELRRVLEESKKELEDVDEVSMQQAIKMSMEGADFGGQTLGAVGGAVSDSGSGKGASKEPAPTAEEVRARRLAFLEKVDKGSPTQTQQTQENPPQVAAQENGEEDLTEEEMLQAAIRMSMEQAK